MFTDIVGYTSLMGKDSAKALELVRINREIQKPLVAVIFGGLASSLVLTLIVLPVLYALVNGLPADGALATQQGKAEATGDGSALVTSCKKGR